MKSLCVAVFFLLFLVSTAAQQPPAPKGSIEGVVVRAGSGQPVAGARVTATRQQARGGLVQAAPQRPVQLNAGIRGAPPVPSPSATADSGGRFILQGLDEGAYSLQVQGNGYVQQNYGQQYAGGPGRAIAVAAGQQVKDIAVSLTPTGNVNGRIRDASDQPLANVPVQLLRYSYNASGQRTFQPAGAASTDDRGEYRIYWVTPGRYYLMAGRPPSSADPVIAMMGQILGGGANASGNPVPAPLDYAYYPGVKDIGAARAIDVQPGAEIQAIDVSLSQKPRTYRVRGLVIDGRTGQPPARASVAATPRTPGAEPAVGADAAELGRNYNPANGTFELSDLLPGTYIVAASIPTSSAMPAGPGVFIPGNRANGSAIVAVSDADVDGVAITVALAATITGRLRFEGQTPRITSDAMLLAPVNSWPHAGDLRTQTGNLRFIATPPGNSEGTFRVDDVAAGEYRVRWVAATGNYIKEARYGGVDVLNAALKFSGPTGETLDVVVGPAQGQVSGVVLDARSQPAPVTRVVLVPDKVRDRAELYRVSTTDQNGSFTMTGIPPGDYRVFSWDGLEQYAWFDPDVLAQSEGGGRAVHVTESSAETIEVRLIPAGGTR
jgi:hypothetical protein